jgi:hypothetical protein
MEEAEKKILRLIGAICQLHRCDRIDAQAVVQSLQEQDFPNVSIELVQAVYGQLEKEAEKYVKPLQENADKARYYSLDVNKERFDYLAYMWSDRYVLFLESDQTNRDFHMLQLFDSYNDKSK